MKEISKAEELHQLGGTSQPAASADAPILLCPTCDEPFTAQFARQCGNCGHEFPDGFDEPPAERTSEGPNPRILFCLGGIVLFTVAALIYLWRLI